MFERKKIIKNKGATLQQSPQDILAPQVTPQTQEVAPQEASPVNQIWRPQGHPPVQVDECVQNVECEGNCEHRRCKSNQSNSEHTPSEQKVTCYDCREEFNTKVERMDHKRDNDHPSKRKCTQDPDCERGA